MLTRIPNLKMARRKLRPEDAKRIKARRAA